jgi:predicted Rossmann fold nucleotide-binding protein DprA/Smf involved in DNA uptake
MRYGIVGSRRRRDLGAVVAFVNGLDPGAEVISGGCRGVDTWAVRAAQERGLRTIVHLPALPPAGSPRHLFAKAYHARNEQIASDCDVLVAFVAADRRGGTEHTIRAARRLGKKVVIL